MAFENVLLPYTIQAGEDLSSYQYHAVSLEDGQLAAAGYESSGILLNKPADKQHAQLGLIGIMKYKAGGGTHTKGIRLAVTTSGWLKSAGSGDFIVGTALTTTTSGSVGTGLLNFTAPIYAFTSSFIT